MHARKGGSHLCIRSKEPLAPTRAPPRDVHSVSCIRACKRKRKPLMHSSFKSTGRVINASGASAQALEYSRLRFVAAIKTHDDILFAVNRVSCTYFCRWFLCVGASSTGGAAFGSTGHVINASGASAQALLLRSKLTYFFKKCLIVWHKSFYLISRNDQDPGKLRENLILLR